MKDLFYLSKKYDSYIQYKMWVNFVRECIEEKANCTCKYKNNDGFYVHFYIYGVNGDLFEWNLFMEESLLYEEFQKDVSLTYENCNKTARLILGIAEHKFVKLLYRGE